MHLCYIIYHLCMTKGSMKWRCSSKDKLKIKCITLEAYIPLNLRDLIIGLQQFSDTFSHIFCDFL